MSDPEDRKTPDMSTATSEFQRSMIGLMQAIDQGYFPVYGLSFKLKDEPEDDGS